MQFIITVPDSIGFKRQGETVQADITGLTAEIAANLFAHGLVQKVGDSAAGKTGTEARDAMAATLAALVAGEWSQRGTGTSVDPIVRFIRDVVRALLGHPTYKSRKAEYKALKEQEARDAYLDQWFSAMPESQSDKITALAAQKLALDQQMRDSVAALRDDLVTELNVESRAEAAEAESELIPAADKETEAKKATKKRK